MPSRIETLSSCARAPRAGRSGRAGASARGPTTATERTLDGDRQDVAAVLQQHEGFARHLAGGLARFRRREGRVEMGRIDVRAVEQADAELGAQHPPDRLVDHAFRHPAGAHLVGQVLDVELAHHVHVDAGEDRLARGLGAVRRDAVVDEFADADPVGGDEAVEAPLLAQHVGQKPGIGRRAARR